MQSPSAQSGVATLYSSQADAGDLTDEDRDVWMPTPWDEAKALQKFTVVR